MASKTPTALDSLTAVQWAWRADDKWILYDTAKNLELENEYHAGTKRVKIDKERFVDLSLSQKVIIKNWFCLDCDEATSIGLQRRYDDETKRRAVQRVPPNFFKGCIFVVFLDDDDQVALVERVVETYGGSIRPSVTKRTKYVIASPESYSNNQVEWDKAAGQDTPILSTEWLAECMRQKKLVDPDADWEVEKPSDAAPKAPVATSSSSSSSGGGVKRKAPDADDDDAAPPPKKAKTASAAAAAAAPAPAPAPTPTPTPAASVPPHAALKSKTSWMGVCAYDSAGGKYPFTLNLLSVVGNQISGTIDWPTLNNAKTKFKGTVSGTQLTFEEYEIIQGEDDVEVPNSYRGTLDASSGETINGVVNEKSPDQAGKWSVTYVEKDEDEDDDAMDTDEAERLIAGVIKPNQKYTGVVIQEHPFEITVESRTGNNITGTIFWKQLKCTTKFRGTIDADTEELSIEEYQIQKLQPGGVEPELPMHYKCAVSPDLENFEGSWGSDITKPEGTFTIKL